MVFLEVVESENGLDKIRLESARDFTIFELVNNVKPGITSAEKESDFGSVEIRVRVREADVCDVEFESAEVGEPEFVERDNLTVIGSDIGETDLREGEGE
jgi:hypothetical protein